MNLDVKYPCDNTEKDIVVIVCLLKQGSVYKQIREELKGIGYQNVLHIYDLKKELSLFEGQNLIIAPDSDFVQKNENKFLKMQDCLEDLESKELLKKIYQYLLGENVVIPHYPMEEQYFPYDIYTKIEDEFVVDCGAFKGDVLRIFQENNNGEFQKYIAIEPDDAYLPLLNSYVSKEQGHRIEVLNCAISDKRETLYIRNYAQENSVIKKDGEKEIEAFSLDELLDKRTCTFLKIDVEGYEKKVLSGASNMIRIQRPVIAVAAYHKEQDFYELGEIIQNIYEGYKFYLRSYMNVQETILYAVPKWRLIKE